MSITIPDEILQQHSEQDVRTELALALYEKMIFTRTQVCQFLEIDEDAFYTIAQSRGIHLRYDVEDLEEDLATTDRLKK